MPRACPQPPPQPPSPAMSESGEGPAEDRSPPGSPSRGCAAAAEPRIIKVTVKTPKEKEEFAVSEASSIGQVRGGGAEEGALAGAAPPGRGPAAGRSAARAESSGPRLLPPALQREGLSR